MKFDNYPRLRKILHVLGESHLREALSVIVGFGSFGLGSSLVLAPSTEYLDNSYQATFAACPPIVWGVFMVGLAIWLGIAMFTNKNNGTLPALLLTLLYLVSTIMSVFALGDNGVPMSIWFNLMLAMMCGVLTASCAVYQEVPPDPTGGIHERNEAN